MPLSRTLRSAKNQKWSKSSGRFTSNKHRKDDDFILEFDGSDNDYSEESDYDFDEFMD